jgi:hypothetical protein
MLGVAAAMLITNASNHENSRTRPVAFLKNALQEVLPNQLPPNLEKYKSDPRPDHPGVQAIAALPSRVEIVTGRVTHKSNLLQARYKYFFQTRRRGHPYRRRTTLRRDRVNRRPTLHPARVLLDGRVSYLCIPHRCVPQRQREIPSCEPLHLVRAGGTFFVLIGRVDLRRRKGIRGCEGPGSVISWAYTVRHLGVWRCAQNETVGCPELDDGLVHSAVIAVGGTLLHRAC